MSVSGRSRRGCSRRPPRRREYPRRLQRAPDHRRRWLLPDTEWRGWEVPFDTDDDWPKPLRDALVAYRDAWRAKMYEDRFLSHPALAAESSTVSSAAARSCSRSISPVTPPVMRP